MKEEKEGEDNYILSIYIQGECIPRSANIPSLPPPPTSPPLWGMRVNQLVSHQCWGSSAAPGDFVSQC